MSDSSYKIFERNLDIDLNRLEKYLTLKYREMLENNLPEENELNDLLVKKYNMSEKKEHWEKVFALIY